jgi:glucosamine-6-phosphate deaminase
MTGNDGEQVSRFSVDGLRVEVFESREAMGRAAAADLAASIREVLRNRETMTMAFAAAPSQDEVLSSLTELKDIDWSRIIAFHLDEYVGLSEEAPQSFRRYLREHIFDQTAPYHFHGILGEQAEPEVEARRYEQLVRSSPPQVVVLGIGENGHLAFNDPPEARFDDDRWVKVVDLSEESRIQQVHDKCFPHLSEVPRQAITMTIPAIMAAVRLHCIVPGPTKADAVARALHGPITEQVPASILRRHGSATLYLDRGSAVGLGVM